MGPVGGCLFKFDFPEPTLLWVGGWVGVWRLRTPPPPSGSTHQNIPAHCTNVDTGYIQHVPNPV